MDVPSALEIIVGRPAITAAAAELLVPRSIPMIFGMVNASPLLLNVTLEIAKDFKNVMAIGRDGLPYLL